MFVFFFGSRQVTLAVMISGWSHVLHAIYKPWGSGSPTYKIQHLSLFTTTFVFVMGLLLKVNGVVQQSLGFRVRHRHIHERGQSRATADRTPALN